MYYLRLPRNFRIFSIIVVDAVRFDAYYVVGSSYNGNTVCIAGSASGDSSDIDSSAFETEFSSCAGVGTSSGDDFISFGTDEIGAVTFPHPVLARSMTAASITENIFFKYVF